MIMFVKLRLAKKMILQGVVTSLFVLQKRNNNIFK